MQWTSCLPWLAPSLYLFPIHCRKGWGERWKLRHGSRTDVAKPPRTVLTHSFVWLIVRDGRTSKRTLHFRPSEYGKRPRAECAPNDRPLEDIEERSASLFIYVHWLTPRSQLCRGWGQTLSREGRKAFVRPGYEGGLLAMENYVINLWIFFPLSALCYIEGRKRLLSCDPSACPSSCLGDIRSLGRYRSTCSLAYDFNFYSGA